MLLAAFLLLNVTLSKKFFVMCIAFLDRTQKQYLFPDVQKEDMLNVENCQLQFSVQKSSVKFTNVSMYSK